jgi:uncharacterized protein YgbK (DUF1537 family)
LFILADDFTGACDAAGAFAASLATLVLLDPRALHEAVDVLAVDLHARELSSLQARSAVQAAFAQIGSAGPEQRVFLKIDSTLRGPIAALIEGALAGSGKDLAVIAPAFPEHDRLLEHGRLLLGGQAGGSLTAQLGPQHTALIGARLARSHEDLDQAVEDARRRGARRVVVDADDASCLESVAAAWRGHPEWLLVGSGGLARQVAPPPPSTSFAPRRGQGPLLVVAGSPAPATRTQLDRLGTHRSDVLVFCTPPTTERDNGESAQAVANETAAWAATCTPGAVILAGGTTARLVCQRLGAHAVRLRGELAPGVPLGTISGGVWDGVTVVTKAGGFGTPDTLVDVARALGVSSNAETT